MALLQIIFYTSILFFQFCVSAPITIPNLGGLLVSNVQPCQDQGGSFCVKNCADTTPYCGTIPNKYNIDPCVTIEDDAIPNNEFYDIVYCEGVSCLQDCKTGGYCESVWYDGFNNEEPCIDRENFCNCDLDYLFEDYSLNNCENCNACSFEEYYEDSSCDCSGWEVDYISGDSNNCQNIPDQCSCNNNDVFCYLSTDTCWDCIGWGVDCNSGGINNCKGIKDQCYYNEKGDDSASNNYDCCWNYCKWEEFCDCSNNDYTCCNEGSCACFDNSDCSAPCAYDSWWNCNEAGECCEGDSSNTCGYDKDSFGCYDSCNQQLYCCEKDNYSCEDIKDDCYCENKGECYDSCKYGCWFDCCESGNDCDGCDIKSCEYDEGSCGSYGSCDNGSDCNNKGNDNCGCGWGWGKRSDDTSDWDCKQKNYNCGGDKKKNDDCDQNKW